MAGKETSKTSGNTPTNKSGRVTQGGPPKPGRGGRGASEQGPRQDAKGGPEGAGQGGSSRGANRLEPSHAREMQKKDRVGAKDRPDREKAKKDE